MGFHSLALLSSLKIVASLYRPNIRYLKKAGLRLEICSYMEIMQIAHCFHILVS